MKKKLLSALLSTALVASLLVGCGGGAASNDAGADAPAADAAADNSAPAADKAADDSAPAADAAASGEKFYIYSWNTELQERLAYVYAANPGMEERIEYVNVGDSNIYQDKIDQLLQTPDAEDYPDIIAFEAGYIMKYTNSDFTIPVTDCCPTRCVCHVRPSHTPFSVRDELQKRHSRMTMPFAAISV